MQRRVRRDPDEAKRLILQAAEQLLADGGLTAVQVRAVAAKVGITDAAVNHHFGTRDQLLTALLKHGGARLRQRIGQVVAGWVSDDADIGELVHALAELYADGYAELALALHQSGWRDQGSGMLDDVVDALHARITARARQRQRPAPDRRHTQLTVAALHQALAMEPIVGRQFRRSAGLTGPSRQDATDTLTWWQDLVTRMLDP
ncbi:TetR/AcrR family transcriptional regulator [Thermomonospora umbrina]|uniref:TetR family transcriptional regulator n=1 Tax=Thermomonospora umbrina TaxID=111806 RepID=A0A3D9T1H1_9ACTN|nr:TetR family transcriptional regulator [Thermomonospora umbrina]REF00681.1 TetR family transcriptional regulator [Thermomonospora umbrina]